IIQAIDGGEKIVIYGDYDVDGITSTALMYEFLKWRGANVSYYIPDRMDEGYGINIMAVNKLFKQGTKLLITVDCGITAIGEVEFANLQGMDVIITDHHTCKDRLPTAAKAIVNPKRPDCDYPFEGLAGVGVAFKLVLALAIELDLNTTECFNRFVDIVTIGTIADVVPLLDENRIIVDKGIKALHNPWRPGIKAIIEVAGVSNRPITASTIAFAIAPRLNAAGRLGSAKTAVELLLTRDENEARRIALELDAENKERQLTEQKIYDEALALIAADPNFDKKKVIVLANEGWHQGVIGIVASRINDLYYKPCILISHHNGIGKGSGRSIPGFNLFDALTHCEKYLTDFGGHAVAAGLNVNMSDLDAFTKEINKYADDILSDSDMIPSIEIDCPVTEKYLTLENAHTLSWLEPFGMDNDKPVFSINGMETAYIFAVGTDGKHLRLRCVKNGLFVNCIGFYMGAYVNRLSQGSIIDIAFQIDINRYQGTENVQLVLKDIKIH
ncbi:MAG: single-stranded-DNA-specific exonuclease RecJ, partial [Oscillospiraceae bacterium]|nr:single-stranded-DNA-specific exonuclease RecJ [Oscillospiraceae bacterium]